MRQIVFGHDAGCRSSRHVVRRCAMLCGGLTLVLLSRSAIGAPTPTPTARRARCFVNESGPDAPTFTLKRNNEPAQTSPLFESIFHPAMTIDIDNDANAQGVHQLFCHMRKRTHDTVAPLVDFHVGTDEFQGFLCIRPQDSACNRVGSIDCDGGTALGFDELADSDIGHCNGNGGCKSKCAAFCQSQGLNSYGSRCAPSQHACKCRCIDRRAGMAGEPGIAQCYLGVHITIKDNNSCAGAPLLDFGDRCFPMTTSSTTTEVDHADFSQSQIGPRVETGTPIQCDAISSDAATGLDLEGQIPVIFGAPSFQDAILSLHMPCVDTPTPKPTNTARPTSTRTPS